MADETAVRSAIADERRALASALATLTPEQWEAPSLCVGWRVRDVVAHVTMSFRYTLAQVVLEMLKSRGRFDAMADRTARRDAARMSTAELTASMAENVDHPWKPPGGGYVGALSHDLIHGLDITVALGLDRRVPLERVRMVVDNLQPRQVKFFGVDLDGVQLSASDTAWTFGSGAPLVGSAQDLLLVLCGRKLPTGQLEGAASGRFSQS